MPHQKKELVGTDVFIEYNGDVEHLQSKLAPLAGNNLALTMISNRGVKVWPNRCLKHSASTNGAAVLHQKKKASR